MSYLCHYCDSLVSDIVTDKNEQGVIIWVGCRECYLKRCAKRATVKK